ncbi:hypothetical protein [Adhaeribacter aquaticus]|uniref:hypothetical protein n=1 Tax=Adhaeribacter aquaticus TaxID=299567 RepID=UPI00040EB1A6|nr:hypothetical protein [Adhaeribacter aquaticus]
MITKKEFKKASLRLEEVKDAMPGTKEAKELRSVTSLIAEYYKQSTDHRNTHSSISTINNVESKVE